MDQDVNSWKEWLQSTLAALRKRGVVTVPQVARDIGVAPKQLNTFLASGHLGGDNCKELEIWLWENGYGEETFELPIFVNFAWLPEEDTAFEDLTTRAFREGLMEVGQGCWKWRAELIAMIKDYHEFAGQVEAAEAKKREKDVSKAAETPASYGGGKRRWKKKNEGIDL